MLLRIVNQFLFLLINYFYEYLMSMIMSMIMKTMINVNIASKDVTGNQKDNI